MHMRLVVLKNSLSAIATVTDRDLTHPPILGGGGGGFTSMSDPQSGPFWRAFG